MDPQSDVWSSSGKGVSSSKPRKVKHNNKTESGSSSPEIDLRHSDSSHEEQDSTALTTKTIHDIVRPLSEKQTATISELKKVKEQMEILKKDVKSISEGVNNPTKTVLLVFLMLALNHVLMYVFLK